MTKRVYSEAEKAGLEKKTCMDCKSLESNGNDFKWHCNYHDREVFNPLSARCYKLDEYDKP